MFDAYRTAEAQARRRLQTGLVGEPPQQDKTIIGWGVFLILLGLLFLLQNIIPYYFFVNRLWPLVFVLLGAYLVYRAIAKPGKAGAQFRRFTPRSKGGYLI